MTTAKVLLASVAAARLDRQETYDPFYHDPPATAGGTDLITDESYLFVSQLNEGAS
ncbi:MAG TPA: hypothetical protein VGO56_00730 [Pyrinomonadaceae bacterium]|jgi:hypothetical protein|nr:hypothetical protein [Pyrinomonadaceae bacterium]